MEKKYQIFISSTYEDLVNERQEIVQAILRADHIPAGMELFKGGRPQEEIIEEWIQASDLYILLLGARYGSLRPEGDMSYTEWEYRKAIEMKIPHVVIALSDDYINEKYDAQNSQLGNPKFQEFRSHIFASELVGLVSNKDQIIGEVSQQLNDLIRKNKTSLVGWVRGDVVDELESAKKSISNLQNQLNRSNERVIQKSNEIISIQRQENIKLQDNLPKEVTDLVDKLTKPKDTDEVLRNEMKWITQFLIDFGKKYQPSIKNPDNELLGGADGKFGLAILQLGQNQLTINADYQENKIKFSFFIRNKQGATTHHPFATYSIGQNGKYVDENESTLSEESLINLISFFLEAVDKSKQD